MFISCPKEANSK